MSELNDLANKIALKRNEINKLNIDSKIDLILSVFLKLPEHNVLASGKLLISNDNYIKKIKSSSSTVYSSKSGKCLYFNLDPDPEWYLEFDSLYQEALDTTSEEVLMQRFSLNELKKLADDLGIKDNEYKGCPICGEPPSVSTQGSCIDIECCVSMSFQKYDYLSNEERETYDSTTALYSSEVENKAEKIIMDMWNTRV